MEEIELNFDAEVWTLKRAADERALLEKASNWENQKAAASIAATKLLRWYVQFGHMNTPEAQAAIDEGIERVMLKVARAAMDLKSRADVTPLDFFVGETGRGGGPKISGTKAEMLALRAAHGDHLTEQDLRTIVTTREGRTVPRSEWPSTLQRLEDALVDHLAGIYNDVPAHQRRMFVRESFPHIPWGAKGRLVYPPHWLTCTS